MGPRKVVFIWGSLAITLFLTGKQDNARQRGTCQAGSPEDLRGGA